MVAFIDEQRKLYGVEPICRILPIAPSTYYEWKRRQRDPSLLLARIRRDIEVSHHIERVWEGSRRIYGARKVWQQLLKEEIVVARCTVERLMRQNGFGGVVRGGRKPRTTVSEETNRPADLVKRNFTAERPNRLWVVRATV